MADSGADSITGKGNEPVLKLLIKYRKKQGKKYKNDNLKHMVSCSMYFRQIWNFYTQTGCGKQMLDAITENHHCKVSLSVDDHMKDFFILDVSDTNVHNKSDVIKFVDEVLHNIEICAEESLSIDTIGIDPKILDEVRERIKDGQELANIWVEFVGDDNPVTVYAVCSKDQQQRVMENIIDIIRDATKSFCSHKEMVTADFMWQMVMIRFEYLKEICLKFPSTEIIQDKNKNAFLLKGPRDEVKAVAGRLEELLKMAHKEVHEKVFSPGCQFEIFASSEMCDYINKSLPKFSVIWIPNHLTKEIHLFSRDPKLLKGMDKRINGCIEEKIYPLFKDNSMLASEKIHLLEELKKKHKGRIVISLLESPTGLLVTTAGDIFGGVDAAVQKIISIEVDTMHPKTCVPERPDGRVGKPNCKSEFGATKSDVEKNNLSSEISDSGKIITKLIKLKDTNLFRKLLMDHMETFNQIGKEHCVSIEIFETQSRVGLELNGLKKEVKYVDEVLYRTAKEQMQLQQL